MDVTIGFIGDNDPKGLKADAKFAAKHGFDELEYNYWGDFKDLTAKTVRQMRKVLDKHGVGVSMLGLWGWNHLSPDEPERAAAHEMLSRAIEFARILEARVLTTGGGDIPGAAIDRKVEEFAKVFPPFLDRIDQAGMKCALYAVHGNSFLDSIEAYERVWVKSPQVGIKFDPANWKHHGADYLAVVRRYGHKIHHVHLKEHLYHNGELASQPPAGMGDIEWGKIMAFLWEHDYQGCLSIEPHGQAWSSGPMRRALLLLTQRYISQFLL